MKFISFVILSTLCFASNAQKLSRDIYYSNSSIKQILTGLEEQFDVKFAYNATVIQRKNVSINLKSATLPDVISNIERQVKLTFTPIDDRYYSVTRSPFDFCGYLIDGDDRLLIEGASVVNTSKNTGVVSNEKGFFTLTNVRESDSLEISFLGYKRIPLEGSDVASGKCTTFNMFSESSMLGEVVLLDYIGSGISRQQDGSITFRPNNSEILSGLAEPDILQNIQLLPGIDSPTENASDINIRGGTPDQNLILLDGIKIYSTDHFYGTISVFNPHVIKEVNVYRSGVKAKYGDRIAGVIDMHMEDEVPDKLAVGVGLNLTHFEANVQIPIRKSIGAIASFRNSISNYVDSPTFGKYASKIFQGSNIENDAEYFETNPKDNRTDFGFSDVNLKFIADVSEKNKIEVTGLFTENKLDYFFKVINVDRPYKIESETQNSGVSLNWTSEWNTKLTTTVQAYNSHYKTKYFAQNDLFGTNYEAEKKNDIEETGIKIGVDIKLSNIVTLGSGYQYFSNRVSYLLRDVVDVDTESIFDSDVYNATNAGFIELSYKRDKLRADVGLRSNYYSRFKKNVFEPRFYSEYNFQNGFRIKGSVEVKNQSLSQIVEFISIDLGLESQIWILGDNEFFPLLNSKQFSLGGLYSKKGWKVDIDGYLKYSNGLTILGRGINLTESEFSSGKSTIRGIDILLKKRVGNYSAWLGYTYSKTEYKFDTANDGRTFNANNDITNSLTLSQFFEWRNFQFSLGYKYRTGIPFIPALGIIGEVGFESIEFGDFNSKRLPDYKRLDFSTIYNFNFSKNKKTKGKFGISLLNILDSKNIIDRKYERFSNIFPSGEVVTGITEIDKVGLTFTPNAFIRVDF